MRFDDRFEMHIAYCKIQEVPFCSEAGTLDLFHMIYHI